MRSLREFDLDGGQLTGPFPRWFLEPSTDPAHEGQQCLPNVQELDFSFNRLTGTIPPEISVKAKLQEFKVEHNHLTGTLPDSLCTMKNLWRIRVEANHMTGRLPACLGNLTATLNELWIDSNDFEGDLYMLATTKLVHAQRPASARPQPPAILTQSQPSQRMTQAGGGQMARPGGFQLLSSQPTQAPTNLGFNSLASTGAGFGSLQGLKDQADRMLQRERCAQKAKDDMVCLADARAQHISEKLQMLHEMHSLLLEDVGSYKTELEQGKQDVLVMQTIAAKQEESVEDLLSKFTALAKEKEQLITAVRNASQLHTEAVQQLNAAEQHRDTLQTQLSNAKDIEAALRLQVTELTALNASLKSDMQTAAEASLASLTACKQEHHAAITAMEAKIGTLEQTLVRERAQQQELETVHRERQQQAEESLRKAASDNAQLTVALKGAQEQAASTSAQLEASALEVKKLQSEVNDRIAHIAELRRIQGQLETSEAASKVRVTELESQVVEGTEALKASLLDLEASKASSGQWRTGMLGHQQGCKANAQYAAEKAEQEGITLKAAEAAREAQAALEARLQDSAAKLAEVEAAAAAEREQAQAQAAAASAASAAAAAAVATAAASAQAELQDRLDAAVAAAASAKTALTEALAQAGKREGDLKAKLKQADDKRNSEMEANNQQARMALETQKAKWAAELTKVKEELKAAVADQAALRQAAAQAEKQLKTERGAAGKDVKQAVKKAEEAAKAQLDASLQALKEQLGKEHQGILAKVKAETEEAVRARLSEQHAKDLTAAVESAKQAASLHSAALQKEHEQNLKALQDELTAAQAAAAAAASSRDAGVTQTLEQKEAQLKALEAKLDEAAALQGAAEQAHRELQHQLQEATAGSSNLEQRVTELQAEVQEMKARTAIAEKHAAELAARPPIRQVRHTSNEFCRTAGRDGGKLWVNAAVDDHLSALTTPVASDAKSADNLTALGKTAPMPATKVPAKEPPRYFDTEPREPAAPVASKLLLNKRKAAAAQEPPAASKAAALAASHLGPGSQAYPAMTDDEGDRVIDTREGVAGLFSGTTPQAAKQAATKRLKGVEFSNEPGSADTGVKPSGRSLISGRPTGLLGGGNRLFSGASGSGQQVQGQGQGQAAKVVIAERRQVIKAGLRGLVKAALPDLSPAQVDAIVAEINKRMTMGSKQCVLAAVLCLSVLLSSFLGQPSPAQPTQDFPAAGPAPGPPPPPDPACPPYAHPRVATRTSPRTAAAPAQLPPPVQLDIWDPQLLAQIKNAMQLLTKASVLEHLMRGPHHPGHQAAARREVKKRFPQLVLGRLDYSQPDPHHRWRLPANSVLRQPWWKEEVVMHRRLLGLPATWREGQDSIGKGGAGRLPIEFRGRYVLFVNRSLEGCQTAPHAKPHGNRHLPRTCPRPFTMLPMVGVRARHFVIDDRVLHGVLTDLGMTTLTRAQLQADSLPHWQKFIRYSQLQNSGWDFARRVETDGVSVSVHFVRNLVVKEPVEPPCIGRELTATSDFSAATHIAVGVDPGVTQAIKAAHAMRDLVTGQVVRQWEWELTKGQLKHDSGLTKAKQDTARWSPGTHCGSCVPCELHLPDDRPRPEDWVPPAGQVNQRLLRPAWSLRHSKDVRGLKWCHEVPPNPPPPPPAQHPPAHGPPAPAPAQDLPAPAQDPPPPAQAPPPLPPAQAPLPPPPLAQPLPAAPGPVPRPQAPSWGRWLDRDTNPCLNFQRIGESKQRPLELCSWKDREALPPVGKEYQQGYKRVNDRLPKARQRLHRAAEYRRGIDGRARNNA
ncbi:hypothetical protein QJQ45_015379 [Haematococcus lacustris]|nr:hypothetical protein QJQ45_015379 [Haematococcus lacustris]